MHSIISYSEIIKNAWQIAIKNKILWFFGIFASFISLEGVYEILLSQANWAKSNAELQQEMLNLYGNQVGVILKNLYFFNLLVYNLSAFLAFILIAAIIVAFIWLIFTSQIFIIKSTALQYAGKKISTKDVFKQAYEKFWPVFLLYLLAKIALLIGFIIIGLPLLYAVLVQNGALIIAGNVFFLIVFTVYAVSISFLAAYATSYIVLRDAHIIDAIKTAWQLFTRNILISLEIAFILFTLKIISLVLIFSLFFIALIPILAILAFSILNNYTFGILTAFGMAFLCFSLISLIINSIYTAFFLSAWTVTFIKLTEESWLSEIWNFINSIPKLFKNAAQKYNLDINKKDLDKLITKSQQKAKAAGEKLEEYKPVTRLARQAAKQSQILAQRVQKTYDKLQPEIKKEISEMARKFKSGKSTAGKKTAAKKKYKK